MKNCFYTIGREGHISIQDQTVSKQHAEIHIKNGDIYLRDLNSTNGTYLVKNNRLVPFFEGYVQPNQIIALGNIHCSVQMLLKLVGQDQASSEDGTTRLTSASRSLHMKYARKRKKLSVSAL